MRKVGRKMSMLFVVAVFSFVAVGSAWAVDPMLEVVGMAQKIADAKAFTVTMHMGYDVVQKSGQKLEFQELRKVVLSRPNYIRVDAKQSDGDEGGLIYDGETITQFSKTAKVYGQVPLKGSVDDMVRFAVARLDVRIPLARMLVTTFPQEIKKLTTEIFYVERDVLGQVPTDHIAGRTEDVDYQVWIGEDKLPRRIVLTYKNLPGQPQFWANFTDWNLSPKVSKEMFTFKPPRDWEKIPVLMPAPAKATPGEKVSKPAKESKPPITKSPVKK